MAVAFNKLANLGSGTSDGDGDSSTSNRQYLASTVLSSTSGGTQCQISILWGRDCPAVAKANALILSYFGQAATTTKNFTGNQVQVTWNGGSASVAAIAGAQVTATISGTVLNVTAVASGTVSVGQQICDPGGPTLYGTISSNGTGSGGTGTYNISGNVSGNISFAITLDLQGLSISDIFTLGEAFDNTKNYIFAYDFGSGAMSMANFSLTGANNYFISSTGTTIASATTPTGSWTEQAGTLNIVAEITVAGTVGIPIGWYVG